MSTEERCGNCRFWWPYDYSEKDREELGKCRRYWEIVE